MDAETRFRALFDSAYPALRRYARNRGLAGVDGEDLVAGTLEIAWRRIDDVPVDDPLPWLYVVAHNLWRNQTRKDRRRSEILARLPASPPASGDPADLPHDALRAALESLSEDDQEVLRLIAWDGLTPAQVATVMGCTPVAARSRLHRARNRLAERLGLDPRVQQAGPARQKQGDDTDLKEVS
ncbi:RNA polymerase sigma factor [Streptomyces sp. NPDC001978]|uniref:RNA polymerase sigma factor n=1 Tax=Streptomyces sp. NPDC001978 TaxID=3364627 RepID=UPI0036C1BEA4